MLKRIKPEQVRLGMFIEAIDGNCIRRSFWRSRFLLDCPTEVVALQTSGVRGVIINTHDGNDVVPAQAGKIKTVQQATNAMQVKRALQTIEQSKPIIQEMFEDARMNGCVSISSGAAAVELIADCMAESAQALIAVSRLKTRDDYTYLHSIAVTALMIHLGRFVKAGENTIRTLGMGGLLHDVGKVKIPLAVLNKTGPLTDHEIDLVRKHPSSGHELLSRQGTIPDMVLDICLQHHERPDGKGYPKGLSRDQISWPVRIASICDVYDALTSKRAYKKAWTASDAARFMLGQDGQFDRPLLMQFFQSLSL